MLYEVITVSELDTAVGVLRQLIDEMTPLYDGLLRRLSPQQRKIVDALMKRGGFGVTPAEIAETARIDALTVRAQLVRLRESGAISLEGGGKGREAYYTVTDRLLSTWYQMRYFAPNRRRIEMFVEVLREWFSPEERFRELKRVLSTHPFERGEAEGVWYLLGSLEQTSLYSDAREHLDREEIESKALEGASDELKAAVWAASKDYFSETHERALAPLQSILERADLSPALRALLFFRCGWIHGAAKRIDQELADYTRCIKLPSAPLDRIAKALINRGWTYGQAGETALALADYTRCIELPGAPVDQIANAFINRGNSYGQAGEIALALADYTRCIELPGAPVDQIAKALVNRGLTYGKMGETALQPADYTRCIELPGAPVEQIARALVNRGFAYGEAGEWASTICDSTRCIELPGASIDLIAMALVNRSWANSNTGEPALAIADSMKCIELPGAPVEQIVKALWNRRFCFLKQQATQSAFDDAIAYAKIVSLSELTERASSLLRDSAHPTLRDQWPVLLQTISDRLPEPDREKLQFFQPVARVLQGEDREQVFRRLAPEEREFAEEVLRKFDPE